MAILLRWSGREASMLVVPAISAHLATLWPASTILRETGRESTRIMSPALFETLVLDIVSKNWVGSSACWVPVMSQKSFTPLILGYTLAEAVSS